MAICTANGCSISDKLTRGLCRKHYMRLLREGTIEDGAGRRRQSEQSARHSRHPLFVAWSGMRNRCQNPNNSSYGRYGARGVTVCNRWQDFGNFLADMGERPEGMTLDRIDPRGPYSPENCRWATAKEQRANVDPERAEAAKVVAGRKISEAWRRWREERQCTPPDEIRQLRKRMGLTQDQFARSLGLQGANAAGTLASYETGRIPISKPVQARFETLKSEVAGSMEPPALILKRA